MQSQDDNMRFNSRELAFLAQSSPEASFDKQGLLQMKEKQEGLFRKGEGMMLQLNVNVHGPDCLYIASQASLSSPAQQIVPQQNKEKIKKKKKNREK